MAKSAAQRRPKPGQRTAARKVLRSKRPRDAGKVRAAETRPAVPLGPPAGAGAWDYLTDAGQRWLLFLDTLRERANNIIGHELAGLPPLLDFKYETVLDGRSLNPPANYALLKITESGEDCAADCVDPKKPPVIVIDPRAGHGPGIGGFKRESEVGMALHEGHQVYFVIFFPDPCPGQTVADVLHALRRFVEEVGRRHPGLDPVLYGNCQAGWAVALLAADCGGLMGPAVLNGSPLSYWAGESGANPMRVAGALMGGVWPAHFLADLSDGRFDGAWLAQNFENLSPAKAIWEKYAGLFANVDGERERFLDFERWWNGFYALSREEIVAIIENLFIGNRLEEGRVRVCEGCYVDLRRIRNPLVIFASYGDNITPPHQALGWIPAVYARTEDLKKAKQRIVYLLNPHVGHLGIFVSAKVARLEHRAILESLDELNGLAPGLYEMKIENPTGDPDCHKPRFRVRFEARRVEDLRIDSSREEFERVRAVSEMNEEFYKSYVSPIVRGFASPWLRETLKWLHPMRTSRLVFSDLLNPGMLGVAAAAAMARGWRRPADKANPYLALEHNAIDSVSKAAAAHTGMRDAAAEALFNLVYGGPPHE